MAKPKPLLRTFPRLIEVARFSIEEAYAIFVTYVPRENEKWSTTINGVVYTAKLDSQRYVVFRQSTECVVCGLKATYFRLDTYPEHKTTCHFNLYADVEGQPTLFTKDHIVPKSKGGQDFISNYQVMCLPCNGLKGSREVGLDDLRKQLSQLQAGVPG